MTRVLFTANPGLGHIHPMVPLAQALARRGHDVRWAVAAEARPRLQAAGFETFPVIESWQPALIVNDASELAAPLAGRSTGVPGPGDVAVVLEGFR